MPFDSWIVKGPMLSFLKKIAAFTLLSCLFGGFAAAIPIVVEPTSDDSRVEAAITSSLCLALIVGEEWRFDSIETKVDGWHRPVPEPGTLALFGIGLLVLGLTSRKAIPSTRPRRKRKTRS